jgi:hypothetical protein
VNSYVSGVAEDAMVGSVVVAKNGEVLAVLVQPHAVCFVVGMTNAEDKVTAAIASVIRTAYFGNFMVMDLFAVL